MVLSPTSNTPAIAQEVVSYIDRMKRLFNTKKAEIDENTLCMKLSSLYPQWEPSVLIEKIIKSNVVTRSYDKHHKPRIAVV